MREHRILWHIGEYFGGDFLNAANTGRGFLRVSVRSANGAVPVPDAQVTIYAADEDNANTGVLYSLRTDESGLTPLIELPAPSRIESMTPGSPTPYARYNIEVKKDGYGGVSNLGAPIFDGVVSTQPVLLVPLSEFEERREETIYESQPGTNPLL